MLQHIGVIMDGNRRWARAHKVELYMGHNKGAENFGHVCDWCMGAGVKFLTVYAFSTENWRRSPKEIEHLFALLEKYFIEEKARCIEKGVRARVIGERSRFEPRILRVIDEIERDTATLDNLHVQIALSYGGRDEIVRAAKKLAADVKGGGIKIDEITESIFEKYLDTSGVPDIDLVIRTGGAENRRLSNFMPWQTAYSELFFSDLLWPEFSREEFDRAVKYYESVKRKLGR
ncbi:MAG: polyprenyl diphosphate synthase [Defluviitaleaceae bacterium]|nr:polyprenyl diphosphate synthase [Defluviitaleaceae bacterium]